MSDSSKLSDEDIELFRKAVENTVPLKQDRVLVETRKPAPDPIKTREDNHAVINEMLNGEFDPVSLERGDELLFLRPGVQKQTLRKLRRGQYNIEDELDLHGMTVEQARTALSEFIKRCQARQKRCVRVIHGKGLGSFNKKPVIKNKVNHWLQKRDEVLAFCSARQSDGGTGAIYLLLKRQ